MIRIWNLADIMRDGSLDLYEYSIARHFIDMKIQGFELPQTLPHELAHPHGRPELAAGISLDSSAVFGDFGTTDRSGIFEGCCSSSTTPSLIHDPVEFRANNSNRFDVSAPFHLSSSDRSSSLLAEVEEDFRPKCDTKSLGGAGQN